MNNEQYFNNGHTEGLNWSFNGYRWVFIASDGCFEHDRGKDIVFLSLILGLNEPPASNISSQVLNTLFDRKKQLYVLVPGWVEG